MAKTPRFIEFSELSQDLRDFIQAGAKIFPIDTFEDLPSTKDKEYYRILSGTHKNEIYSWSDVEGSYVLIGADDRDIRWADVKEKPIAFPAETHTHTKASITDFPTAMTPTAHTHTEAEISNLDKYTKNQVDTAIANMGNTKANTVHTHTKSSITDFAHGHPISEIVNLQTTLDDKVDKVTGKGLSANDYTDDDKTKLSQLHSDASFDYTAMGEALNSHKTSDDHDSRYNTKTEITTALSNKAENSTVNGHISNTTSHTNQTEKDAWNAKWNYNEETIKGVKVNESGNSDTVNNLTVETAVPLGALFTDTVYTHPVNHPPSIITQDANNIFVTYAEKTTWNSKSNFSGSYTDLTNKPSIPTKTSDITNDSNFITAAEAPVQSVAGRTGTVVLTKTDVGLANVDNKSSATIRGEITSTNVTSALGYTPLSSTLKGSNNGLAELDANGKVPASQLPSYVDDVLEFTNYATLPVSGEAGKIYITQDTNKTYRWSGSGYAEISPSIALGETSATAYRGDRGKIAYDHSQVAHAPSDAQKNSDITKAEIEAKLTGVISTHTHASGTPSAHAATHATGGGDAITPADIGAATSGHLHTGTYEPAFTKNTAFNKNFGTAAGTVTQGNDSRLSDARTPLAHTHTKSEVTDFTHTHAIGDLPVATSGTSSSTQIVRADDSRLSNARTPVAHTHTKANITDFAHTHAIGDLPVATSGENSSTKVVRADDTRLSNSRTPLSHTHTLSDITDKGNLASINTNSSTSNFLRGDGTWVTPPNTTYSAMSVAEGLTGTATTSMVMRADYLKQIVQHYAPSIVSALPTTNLHAGMTFYKEV